MSKATYHYEQFLFSSAVAGLEAAMDEGIDTSGVKEIIKVETRGKRILFRDTIESYPAELIERFNLLGSYAELAAVLPKPVDQQG
jgi:hypothetical protein